MRDRGGQVWGSGVGRCEVFALLNWALVLFLIWEIVIPLIFSFTSAFFYIMIAFFMAWM